MSTQLHAGVFQHGYLEPFKKLDPASTRDVSCPSRSFLFPHFPSPRFSPCASPTLSIDVQLVLHGHSSIVRIKIVGYLIVDKSQRAFQRSAWLRIIRRGTKNMEGSMSKVIMIIIRGLSQVGDDVK